MMKREVRVEFGDGSVAVYGVKDGELLGLLDQLRAAGVVCAIWVDGRPWTDQDRPECGDGSAGQGGPDSPQ
ncbi:hypothetical protein MYXO_01884 [Myxococcaceae bacterium]|nr:hypothetical protein MYXO_01884 [Myxococcaceae bacterium]